jgi:hypothetical protein
MGQFEGRPWRFSCDPYQLPEEKQLLAVDVATAALPAASQAQGAA